jgi:arylsulfatase A
MLTGEQQSTLTQRYTDEAVSFIIKNKDQPFFLYLPHTAVHRPIWTGDEFKGKSQNGRFGDWVEEVDGSTGRILDALTKLDLSNNTLVIFTSDNGPWGTGADAGSAGPLRGTKGSTWEGGMREPTLAWWPGRIPAGTTCDAVAGTIDLLPTCVVLAGGSVPETPVIDGKDISPLLFGTSTISPREAHYYFNGYNLEAVRQGPWKLAIKAQGDGLGSDGMQSAAADSPPRLYNLDAEIGEKTDVAVKHPDIVARLLELANKKAEEIGGNSPTSRRPAGIVINPKPLYSMEKKGVTTK